MKILIIVSSFLFIFVTNVFSEQTKQTISTAPIGAFGCDCESQLSQSFNDFQSYIIENNLQKLLDNLVDFYNNIESTTAELEAQQITIKQSNNTYKEKVIELEHYLYNLKKQKSILTTSEGLTNSP